MAGLIGITTKLSLRTEPPTLLYYWQPYFKQLSVGCGSTKQRQRSNKRTKRLIRLPSECNEHVGLTNINSFNNKCIVIGLGVLLDEVTKVASDSES